MRFGEMVAAESTISGLANPGNGSGLTTNLQVQILPSTNIFIQQRLWAYGMQISPLCQAVGR